MLSRFAEIITAQMITRLLIISYFVAIALGLITGVDITHLAAPFLPDLAALYLMRLIILSLCGMVLFGIFRRPAALVLALVVFWTSYLTLYAGGDIGAFWRDLALIGGLLLTANITTYADRAIAADWEDEEEFSVEPASEAFSSEPDFREDFNVVRAS